MSQIKKRVKTGHKRTGDQNEVRHQKKKNGASKVGKAVQATLLIFTSRKQGYHTEQRFYLKSAFYEKTIISPPIKA